MKTTKKEAKKIFKLVKFIDSYNIGYDTEADAIKELTKNTL